MFLFLQQEPVVEPETADNAYNDLMVNYFLGASDPVDSVAQQEPFGLQRRSDAPASSNNNQGVIPLSSVLEVNKNTNNSTGSETTPAPPAPEPSQVPQQVKNS